MLKKSTNVLFKIVWKSIFSCSFYQRVFLTICWQRSCGFNGKVLPPTQKSGIHFAYKNCTRCIQVMHAKCIRDIYKIYATFQQTSAYIFYTKLKEVLQLNFVYKMYTKVCWNVGYILYTFCIHQFWSTKRVHHTNYVYILYTKIIQNVYKSNYMQNGSCISTYVDPIVVLFLS